jgi:hypothetical protein
MSSGRRPRPPRDNRPTPDEIRAMQDRRDAHAKEVLDHMYEAVLKTPEFTLKDGTTCRVDAFYKPEVNSDGELKCGFDILFGDGTHLEFTVGHTGWGKSFVTELAEKTQRHGRGRK